MGKQINFETYLDRRTAEYIATIREQHAGKKLIIYGAGKIGTALCQFFEKHDIPVDSFCVTSTESTPVVESDLPIIGIDNIGTRGNGLLFAIGVKRSSQTAIIKTLKSYGFQDFIELPDFMGAVLDDRFRRPLIQVTPKTGCSVNCRYCPQELFIRQYFSRSKRGMMSLADYKNCLDKTPLNTIIEFAGFSEPFLNPDAAEMMLYTASTGREVNLFTTLVGMTQETWEKIRDIPFTLVVLHLPDVKGYANIPVTTAYRELLCEVMAAKKPNGSAFVDMVNSQSTISPDIKEIIRGGVYVDASKLIDRAGNLQGEDLAGGGVPHGPLFCPTALKLDHNILLPDGSLVLCCMDFGMQHVLGNLLTESYEEIMQGEPMRQIVEKMGVETSEGLLCRKCVRAVPIKRKVRGD